MTIQIARRRLVDSAAIRVDRVRYTGLTRAPSAELHEPATQIVVTLAGAFLYHVGRQHRLVDANRLAYVRAGETTRDSHPSTGAVDALVITPAPELVDGPCLPQTALATARLQLAAAALAHAPDEESALQLLHDALPPPDRAPDPSAAVRLAERAKAELAPAGPPIALTALARRLAVSPAYLTDAFRRAEGLPLVRYQLRLRLARALAELPHCTDLTALALELGFSSHSHFSTAFRATMGVTPSQYRKNLKARARART